MHVLAAIGAGQAGGGAGTAGARSDPTATTPTDDRAAGPDPVTGELVVLPLPGERDLGLRRAGPRTFVGVDSHADVVAAEVIDVDVSPHVVMGYVQESLGRRGTWDADVLEDAAAQLTAEMISVAQQFPLGTIVEKDGPLLHARVPTGPGRLRPVCGRDGDRRPRW